ncbi:MAG: deoxyribose-phosphate aldolase, partial [Nitrospirota bacterium]|nr:deoxyribose-phosphate aldolase [Nitrospirota bacterium]
CEEAGEHGFHSICVHPFFVRTAGRALFRTHVKISAVVGFPFGMNQPEVKIYEAIGAVINGADELDIVMNIGLARSNDWAGVEKEIADIVTATRGAAHKIIIEACYLTDDEKIKACAAVMNAGAEFIKTSTGFGPSGALISDVELIRSVTKGRAGIKAAGNIRTLSDIKAFVKAGATRIGTSSGVEIMKELT